MPRSTVKPVKCAYCGTTFPLPRHRRKRSKNLYCSTECMGQAQRKDPKRIPTKQELRQMYHQQGLTKAQIAEEIDASVWVVGRYFKEYGIKLRTRAERAKLDWEQADKERRDAAAKRLNEWRQENIDKFKEFAHQATLASLEINGPTNIEKLMMDALDEINIDYVFQYVVGEKFACDFGFPQSMLIVECDGLYWHSTPEAQKRDASKDAYLKACGYTVLRFVDEQIIHDVSTCIAEIQQHL